jgi:ankyrin repeat protein
MDSCRFFAGEGELLFSPLSFMEVVGMPRFQIFEGKQVVVVQVKININLKAQTIEDMIAKRQQMHLASFGLLEDSVKYEIQKIADEENAFKDRLKEDKFRKDFTVDKFVEGIVSQVQNRRRRHEEIQSTEYLDNDIFRGLVIDMLDTAAMAQSKMRLYLTDKSLYIRDVAKLSLSAAQRMLIAYFTKNLPVDGQGSDLKAAEALCRLKGLKNALTGDQRALIAAVANGLSLEDLKLLRDTGIDLNKQDEDGSTAIYVAAQCGNARCIQSLVDLNADVNAKDTEDRTALFAAANIGDKSCIQLMVSLRADVSVLDKQKTSPLMVAASAGYFDCVLELGLIDGGNAVNLEQLKPEMLSALVVAIEKGQINVVDFIVKFIAKDKMVAETDFSDFCIPLFKRIDLKGLSLGILRYGVCSHSSTPGFFLTILQMFEYLITGMLELMQKTTTD